MNTIESKERELEHLRVSVEGTTNTDLLHRSGTSNLRRDEFLDLVRGLSAVLVLSSHVRALVLRDFGELGHTTLLVKAGYFLTGLGHQAVIVFFVLSGYFVGGSVIEALRRDRFSWWQYAVARLSRLWVVLFPALILTMILDRIGEFSHPGIYTGEFQNVFRSGPSTENPLSLSPICFIGNLLFLQTIAVPVYGTNGPLWSLANEFWYYVLFPLLATSVAALRMARLALGKAIFGMGFASIVASLLPFAILSQFSIWLLGVGVYFVSRNARLMGVAQSPISNIFFGLLFLATLVASKRASIFGTDLSIGVAFALWVPCLLGTWRIAPWCRRISTGLSDISYSLYATHLPVAFLLAAVWYGGRQFDPSMVAIANFIVLVGSSIATSWVMWWLFEANTNKVRRLFSGKNSISSR